MGLPRPQLALGFTSNVCFHYLNYFHHGKGPLLSQLLTVSEIHVVKFESTPLFHFFLMPTGFLLPFIFVLKEYLHTDISKVSITCTHCFVYTDFYILFLLTNTDHFLSSKTIDSLPVNSEKPIVSSADMDERTKICPCG